MCRSLRDPFSLSFVLPCRLIAAVFRLCEVENQAVDAKLVDFLSPQVGSTVMWFLERWSDAYVLHDEMDYVEVIHTL